MNGFKRKDLSKRRWTIPGVDYFRQLDEYAAQLEEENAQLKEKLAVSGSRALQDRAAQWAECWQELNIEIGELAREKIELESRKNAEIERLQREISWLNKQLEQYEDCSPNSQKRRTQTRDAKTGRFTSSTPEGNKKSTAYQMSLQGYSNLQIAQRLEVSVDTVKRYIRDMAHADKGGTVEQIENAACYY